jgi:hypothetical protein
MERRYLQLMVKRPEGMLVEGLRRGRRVSIPERVGDSLIREAVHVIGSAAGGTHVEATKESVPIEDGQGAADGTSVALRYRAVPEKFGGILRAEAEELRDQFESSPLRWVFVRKWLAVP